MSVPVFSQRVLVLHVLHTHPLQLAVRVTECPVPTNAFLRFHFSPTLLPVCQSVAVIILVTLLPIEHFERVYSSLALSHPRYCQSTIMENPLAGISDGDLVYKPNFHEVRAIPSSSVRGYSVYSFKFIYFS